MRNICLLFAYMEFHSNEFSTHCIDDMISILSLKREMAVNNSYFEKNACSYHSNSQDKWHQIYGKG